MSFPWVRDERTGTVIIDARSKHMTKKASTTATATTSNATDDFTSASWDRIQSGYCGKCHATQTADGKPLLSCGKCKRQKYCSRSCQKADWKEHQAICHIFKAAAEEKVTGDVFVGLGMMIKPMRIFGGEGYIIEPRSKLPQQLLDNLWGTTSIPLTKVLGFPLRVAAFDGEKQCLERPNEIVASLGYDVDPESESFGQVRWGPQRWPIVGTGKSSSIPMGPMMLLREDGKTLHREQIETLVAFERRELREIREVKEKKEKGEKVDTKALAERLLTPEAFKRFYEKEREIGLVKDPKAWSNAWCPV